MMYEYRLFGNMQTLCMGSFPTQTRLSYQSIEFLGKRIAFLRAIDSRARAELGAKAPIEIRNVAESAIQRHIQNVAGLTAKLDGGPAQAYAKQVLVWRYPRQTFERLEKMIGAQTGRFREMSERMAVLRMQLVAYARLEGITPPAS